MAARIGVIGGGTFGINHLRAFRQLGYTGQAELVALADVNEERCKHASRNSPSEATPTTGRCWRKKTWTRVAIVTPDHLHREIAVYLCRAGKHVLVEKPLDVTVAGCREMIDAAQQANVLLQVDFHKRYDPEHEQVQIAVRNGELGEILYGYAHMEDRIEVPVDWFPAWAGQSSPVWFLGVHFFDLVRWIWAATPKRVFATGQRRHPEVDGGRHVRRRADARRVRERGRRLLSRRPGFCRAEFEAVVNQGMRLVGTKGVWEVDTQDRGVAAPASKAPACGLGTAAFSASARTNVAGLNSAATAPRASRTLRLNVNFLLDGRFAGRTDGASMRRAKTDWK